MRPSQLWARDGAGAGTVEQTGPAGDGWVMGTAGWGRRLCSEPRSQTRSVRPLELPGELWASERSPGSASLAGTISEMFPSACLLPASVNNAADSSKHVFLRRLLFPAVSGVRMAPVAPGEQRWWRWLWRWAGCGGVEADLSSFQRGLGCCRSPAAPSGFGEQRRAVEAEEERLKRRELVPRQPHARANNNLWKHFPAWFSPGRPN